MQRLGLSRDYSDVIARSNLTGEVLVQLARMNLSDELLMVKLDKAGFVTLGDQCLVVKFLRSFADGSTSGSGGSRTGTRQKQLFSQKHTSTRQKASSFTRVRTVSDDDTASFVLNSPSVINPLRGELNGVDASFSQVNPGLDDEAQLRKISEPSAPVSELRSIWIRFRWQLVIGAIVLLEGIWFCFFYRMYSKGSGSIFWYIRGFPGMLFFLLPCLRYLVLLPHAHTEAHLAKRSAFACQVLGALGFFLAYNSEPFENPIFENRPRLTWMGFLLWTCVAFFNTAILPYIYRKQLSILVNNRPPLLLVMTAAWSFLMYVVFVMYGVVNLKTMDGNTITVVNTIFISGIFFLVVKDTRLKAKIGNEEFVRKYSGTYMYLCCDFFSGNIFMFATTFKLLHSLWCGQKSTTCRDVNVMMFLLSFSAAVTIGYLFARVVVNRAAPPHLHALFMLPCMFTMDFFCELIFLDFDVGTPRFWILALFDTWLLVMRDAELWDDVANWVWKKYGAGAGFFLAIAEMLGGNADGVAERMLRSKKAHTVVRRLSNVAGADSPGASTNGAERRKATREITETAVLSEVLASTLILLVIAMDVAYELHWSSSNEASQVNKHCVVTAYGASDFPECKLDSASAAALVVMNESAFCAPPLNSSDAYKYCTEDDVFDTEFYSRTCLKEQSMQKRYTTLLTFVVVTVLQFAGLGMSHRIVQYKNDASEKIERIAIVARESKKKLDAGLNYHFFLSHTQATGQDQTSALCTFLQGYGFICWYDMDAEDLTSDGMAQGVLESDIYVLFLSAGVLTRPFVHMELREAKRLNKRIVTIYEPDERHGAFNFNEEGSLCPEDLRFVLQDIEAIPYRRRKYEKQAMVQQIMLRAGDSYYAHLERIDRRYKTQQRKNGPAKRSSLEGAWFMADEHLRSTENCWKNHLALRILMLIGVVHGCLLGVLALRKDYGLGISGTGQLD
jgi:hypothetical protein